MFSRHLAFIATFVTSMLLFHGTLFAEQLTVYPGMLKESSKVVSVTLRRFPAPGETADLELIL